MKSCKDKTFETYKLIPDDNCWYLECFVHFFSFFSQRTEREVIFHFTSVRVYNLLDLQMPHALLQDQSCLKLFDVKRSFTNRIRRSSKEFFDDGVLSEIQCRVMIRFSDIDGSFHTFYTFYTCCATIKRKLFSLEASSNV